MDSGGGSAKGGGKRGDKSGGKRPKGAGKGAGKTPSHWVAEIWENGSFIPVCRRYHNATCTNPQCRYSHKCPVKDASGKPCLANHRAADHPPASPRT